MQPQPCFVEIRTRKLEDSAAFFGKIFDWNLTEVPGIGMPNRIIATGKNPSAGLFVMDPMIPTGVAVYFSVDDCKAVGHKAASMGAELLADSREAPGGMFSCILDIWGNEVGFWQSTSEDEPPSSQVSGDNAFCWLEFTSRDIEAAEAFYKELLGWEFTHDHSMPDYAHIGLEMSEAHAISGIGLAGGQAAEHARGVLAYIETKNLEQTTEAIKEAGGQVVFGPQSIGGSGRFIAFTDLDGNRLAAYQSAPR